MSACLEGADIALVRGNNYPPALWQFLVSENPDVLFDLAGSIFKLQIGWPGGSINVASDDGSGKLTIDTTNSIVSWTYSTTDSRSIPQGRLATYELERWIAGTQQDFIGGSVIAGGGNNPD